MHIPSKHVYEALEDAGVNVLNHANSVVTACQFLRAKSLLSRGDIERRGLRQTKQSSDEGDKRNSVWFDVFTDSVDIHSRAKRANVYGPVLFELDAQIISETYTGRVWVTKLNPTKWAGKTEVERWFQGKEDLAANFVRGQFDQMVVFRHCGGELPFRKYLTRIVLDDPKKKGPDGVDLFSSAHGALTLAMSDSGLKVPIVRRDCVATCTCIREYTRDSERCQLHFTTGLD